MLASSLSIAGLPTVSLKVSEKKSNEVCAGGEVARTHPNPPYFENGLEGASRIEEGV